MFNSCSEQLWKIIPIFSLSKIFWVFILILPSNRKIFVYLTVLQKSRKINSIQILKLIKAFRIYEMAALLSVCQIEKNLTIFTTEKITKIIQNSFHFWNSGTLNFLYLQIASKKWWKMVKFRWTHFSIKILKVIIRGIHWTLYWKNWEKFRQVLLPAATVKAEFLCVC